MNFSQEDVQKLAKLSRIHVSEGELERMQKTLSGILEYVELIGKVDTSEISDTESGLEPRVRPDEVSGCDEHVISRIVSQFPDRENDSLVVPGVFNSLQAGAGSREPEKE